MSSKTRKNVEDRFNVKSFGTFADLDKGQSTDEMLKLLRKGTNQTSNFRWGGRYRWSNNRSVDKEKSLQFQMLGVNTLGVVFQNFFDGDLKDIIKPIATGGYNSDSKAWIVPLSSKDTLVKEVF